MARKLIWFSNDEQTHLENYPKLEMFSVAQDLKLEQKPIKQRYKLLVQDYTRFIQSKKASLTSEEVNILDQMFILRFNNLVNQLEENIEKNELLGNLLGITDVAVKKAANLFSKEYKKLIRARKAFGYIPRMNQEKLDDAYKLLIAELRKEIFAPVINLFSWDPSELPESIKPTEEQKKLLSSPVGMSLSQIHALIVGFMRDQNLEAKVELDKDDKEIKIKFEEIIEDEKDNPEK